MIFLDFLRFSSKSKDNFICNVSLTSWLMIKFYTKRSFMENKLDGVDKNRFAEESAWFLFSRSRLSKTHFMCFSLDCLELYRTPATQFILFTHLPWWSVCHLECWKLEIDGRGDNRHGWNEFQLGGGDRLPISQNRRRQINDNLFLYQVLFGTKKPSNQQQQLR